MDKKEAIKELKFEKNISAGVMEQLGTTKALREIVAIQQKKNGHRGGENNVGNISWFRHGVRSRSPGTDLDRKQSDPVN